MNDADRRTEASSDAPLDPQLLALLDAARPHGDDLQQLLPAEASRAVQSDRRYADYYERSRSFDAAVAQAFSEVPLPPGLAERLTAALAADQPLPEPASLVTSRRRWLQSAAAALTTTAAGTGLFLWWRGRGRPELAWEAVLDEALAFHDRQAAAGRSATPISERPAPAEFPLSRYVAPHAEPRWSPLDRSLLGRLGAAYELAPLGEPRAVLYVLASRGGVAAPTVTYLPGDPFGKPSTTGGYVSQAWREDDCILILVVDGDEHRYGRFLRGSRR